MTHEAARLMFATFPTSLKVEMKGAAIRNAWCADTWTLQVGLVSDALLRGEDPEAMADAYSIMPRIEKFT